MKREHSYLLGLATLLCFAMVVGCKSIWHVEWEPIQRKEVSPYIEQVMKELNDSCRLISIENRDGFRYYRLECKNEALKIRNYLIKK